MKWVKRILLVLALIALFAIGALITVAVVVDPNDYKPQIEALVETHTGRDLTIEGNIGLSLFPWLGLELTNVSLGNPKGFSEPRFAAVEKVNIKVALLPLFKLQTRVGVLQLKGLRLNLETRADGVSNWEGLGETGEPAAAPENPAAPAPESPAAGGGDTAAKALAGLYVGGIDIEDAAVILRDEANATQTRVEHINLNTGAIRINAPIDFKASFSVRNDHPKLIGGMELRGTAVADVNNARYQLTNIALNGKVSGEDIPGHEQTLDLTVAGIEADLNAGTAAVKAVSARLAGLSAGLDAAATGIDGDAPDVTGKINLHIDSLKRTLGTLAVPLPITADEAVLETVTFNAAFKAGKDALDVSDIAAALDDSHLTGQLAVRGFEQPAITFDLALDAIDADRYLPPAEESPPVETPPPADGETGAEIELPVETLRTLDIDGRFRIGALQIMNLKTANIDTGLKARDGVIDLKPLAVDLYQGKFRGSAGLDVTGDIPRYTSTLQLSGVSVGPLMQDFMDKRLLEGSMNADATVNTAGNRVSGLMEELDGKFSLAFRDGALSMNVRESLRNLKAKLKGKEPATKPVGEPTKFSSITASGVIENGTVKNQDLEVRARQLYVTGKGSYQLPADYIDYVLTILLSDDGAGQDDPLNDLYDFPIEFPLKGKLDEIDYAGVGLKALGSAVANKVKAEVGAAKDAARAELQRKQAAARAELEKQDAARKAELERERKAKEEELKKKLEDKKKEALKNLFH